MGSGGKVGQKGKRPIGSEMVFLAGLRVCFELSLDGKRIVFWIGAVAQRPCAAVNTPSRIRTRAFLFGGATDVGFFVVVMFAGAVVKVCLSMCIVLSLGGRRIVFWIGAVAQCPCVAAITHSRARTHIFWFGGGTGVGFFVVVMFAGAFVKVCLSKVRHCWF